MEKKLTKKEMYEIIMEETEREDVVEFCKHEIELLNKKRASGTKKVNETVEKNVEIVYNALAEIGKATVSELIAKADLTEIADKDTKVVSTQRVSAYLKKLVDCGRVEKITEKKKTYFFLKG